MTGEISIWTQMWPYVVILIGGWLATEIWRFLGVFLSGHIRDGSEILIWVRAVAIALIAGLIARLVLFPTGFLSETPMWLRLLAVVSGCLGYKVANDRLIAGILVAEITLIAGWAILT